MLKRGAIHLIMNRDISVNAPAKVEFHIKTLFSSFPEYGSLKAKQACFCWGFPGHVIKVTADQVYFVPTFWY